MMLRTRGGFEKNDVYRGNGFEWRGPPGRFDSNPSYTRDYALIRGTFCLADARFRSHARRIEL